MQKPVEHVASMNSVLLPSQVRRDPPKEPTISAHLPTALNTVHYQIQTDLKQWMTFDMEERIRKAKALSHMDTDASRYTPEAKAEALLYIIRLENAHPLGDSKPAAVAFHGLFPKNGT